MYSALIIVFIRGNPALKAVLVEP